MIRRLRRAVELFALLPFAVRLACPVLWAALIWWHSSGVRVTARLVPGSFLKNAGHALTFGVLAAMIAMVVRGSPRARVAAASALSAAYGVVDELHQSFVPGRSASAWDAVTDALGALWFAVAAVGLLHGEPRAARVLALLLPVLLLSVAMATWA